MPPIREVNPWGEPLDEALSRASVSKDNMTTEETRALHMAKIAEHGYVFSPPITQSSDRAHSYVAFVNVEDQDDSI